MTRLSLFLALTALLLAGCEAAHLGPDLRGTIEGEAFDAASGEAVAGASVTTTPPTTAPVTDAQGRFAFEDVPAGTYSIRVNSSGYAPATVSVTVRENRITAVAVPLEPSGEDAAKTDSLAAEVVNWSNRVAGQDSTVVDVEYRVVNVGDVDLRAYEVYLRIETTGGLFFAEAGGDTLRVGQADVGLLSKPIRAASAQQVVVDGTWTEPVGG